MALRGDYKPANSRRFVTAVERADLCEKLSFVFGDAFAVAQVVRPGAQVDGFDPDFGITHILEQLPAPRAIAPADAPPFLHEP